MWSRGHLFEPAWEEEERVRGAISLADTKMRSKREGGATAAGRLLATHKQLSNTIKNEHRQRGARAEYDKRWRETATRVPARDDASAGHEAAPAAFACCDDETTSAAPPPRLQQCRTHLGKRIGVIGH